VLGVPCTTTVRDLEAPLPAYAGRGRPPKAPWQAVTQWRQSLDAEAWTHLTGRDGENGPVAIAMVRRRVQTRLERNYTGPEEWLVVTRQPRSDDRIWGPRASRDAIDQDARYRYHYYLSPTCVSKGELAEPSLAELARVIKAGACIEASFQRSKSEVGMDEYQGRTWEGWHHHMALSLLAVWFLIGETHRGQQVTPALTLPQVRYGLSLLLLAVFCPFGVDDICRQVQRQLQRRLLLDSRVVGFAEVVPPNCCHFSSLKPFFFNGPKKELCFSDNAWSINRFSSTLLYTARETQAVPGRGEDPHFYIFCSFTERTPLSVPAQLSSAQCLRAG